MRQRTEASLEFYSGHPELIPARIAELDRECDLETTFGAASSALSLYGLVQGLFRAQRWFVLPAVLQGFVLQHALRGWTPPLTLLRRLGLRTREEIQEERRELLRLYDVGAGLETSTAFAVAAEEFVAGTPGPTTGAPGLAVPGGPRAGQDAT
jgi:hypothetical protein